MCHVKVCSVQPRRPERGHTPSLSHRSTVSEGRESLVDVLSDAVCPWSREKLARVSEYSNSALLHDYDERTLL